MKALEKDETYMERCLQIARGGLGWVAPNPMVGCVIVKDGKIIGEGFHTRHGEAHAEVNALASVPNEKDIVGATMYVNLEPCVHYGKTPPCSDRIIAAGIKKVIIAGGDPNEKVKGKGIEKLRQNGVEVEAGLLEDQEMWLNRRFRTFHLKKRPYIVLKWAQSVDGFMDVDRQSGEKGQYKISGEQAFKLVHRWRSEEQAILVGSNTVLTDDPSLNVRAVHGQSPVRLIIDLQNRVKGSLKILEDGGPTIIYNTEKKGVEGPIEYVQLNQNTDVIEDLLKDLHARGIQSVLVEGGKITLEKFLDQVWDEARIFVSKNKLGAGLKSPNFDLSHLEPQILGDDQLYIQPFEP